MVLCSSMKEMLLRAADRSEDAQSCYEKQLSHTSQVQGCFSGGELVLSEGDEERLKRGLLSGFGLLRDVRRETHWNGSGAQRGRVGSQSLQTAGSVLQEPTRSLSVVKFI